MHINKPPFHHVARRLLTLCALILGCTLLCARSFAGPDAPPPTGFDHPPEVFTAARLAALPSHPRLLATAARWEELRSQVKADPDSHRFFDLLVLRADEYAALPPSEFKTKTTRELIRTQAVVLAAVYRLTLETRYLDAARARLVAVATEPWAGGLDNALICIGFSLVYDWLHPELSPDERASFAAVILTKALRDSVPDSQKKAYAYLWAGHNWNQVCNSALALGALASAECDPALATHILNRSLAMISRATTAYAPDGVYPEGPTYWEFGTTQQVIFMDALHTALGTTAGLETAPGLLASSDFIEATTGPTGLPFNFSDAREPRMFLPAMLWFARERAQLKLATSQLSFVSRFHEAAAPAGRPGENDGPNFGIGLVLGLLWWQPALLASSSGPATPETAPSVWIGRGSQPIAVLRSSAAAHATWLAIKGGSSGKEHAHMDAGSFVLEAGGVRWALDPGIQEYQKVIDGGIPHGELFNLAQGSRRWTVFRIGPEAHNILRFDAAPQDVKGQATISPLIESADGASVEIDLNSTYVGQVASVRRRATLRPDASVILADSWTALDKPTTVTAQWLTRAAVKPTPDGLLLEQDGRTLRLNIAEIDAAKIEIQPIAPMLNPKIDSPAPDLQRIVIRVSSPAKTTGTLTIHAIPGPRL